MPNTTIENFGIPDRVDILMNTHHLNDRVVSIHSLLQYQFLQTDQLEQRLLKHLSLTNKTELASTKYQFTSFLMPQEQKQ